MGKRIEFLLVIFDNRKLPKHMVMPKVLIYFSFLVLEDNLLEVPFLANVKFCN